MQTKNAEKQDTSVSSYSSDGELGTVYGLGGHLGEKDSFPTLPMALGLGVVGLFTVWGVLSTGAS